MSAIREHDGEPIPGLPERLPAGEEILWQGAPCWRTLARRLFHVRKLVLYFGVLVAWRAGTLLIDGAGLQSAAVSALWMSVLGAAAIGLAVLFAWLIARATLYTITNRRVVMRHGVALPMCLNLPFRRIGGARLRTYADGSGDIPLSMVDGDRVAYLHLWPHARPWRFTNTEPMLRGIPEAAKVGEILADAMTAAQAPAAAGAPVQSPQQAAPRPAEPQAASSAAA